MYKYLYVDSAVVLYIAAHYILPIEQLQKHTVSKRLDSFHPLSEVSIELLEQHSLLDSLSQSLQ